MTVDQLVKSDDKLFKDVVVAAVQRGAPGEALLVSALSKVEGYRRTTIISALGETSGGLGGKILRSVVSDKSEDTDTRCAGTIALAKREGVRASDIFAELLDDNDQTVRDYALTAIGCVGDDRAWARVYRHLQKTLPALSNKYPFAMNPRSLSVQSKPLAGVVYLGRHLHSDEQMAFVVELIHSNWDRLSDAEQDWFKEYWPSCVPGYTGQMQQPDAERIANWLRWPLMNPLYLKV